ncbi:MAG: MbcA/ParS/Xre antitoxin family protein [Pseudomonadales bacterium]
MSAVQPQQDVMASLLNDAENTAGSLLPALFNICDSWQLKGTEKMVLLGLSNEKTLYNWIKFPNKAKLTRDFIERASYILGIYKALQILFPTPENADRWLTSPNSNPAFGGKRPVDRMLAGNMMDIAFIRNFLDAERGAW